MWSQRVAGSRAPLMLLFRAAFVLLVCASARSLPVPHSVDVRQTPNTVHSRDACLHTSGSCQFYSHCVDTIFPCGRRGAARAYAEPRCKRIRLLTTPPSPQYDCPSCLSHPDVVRWARAHESCLQDRLFELAEEFNRTLLPDPPSCLRFEDGLFAAAEVCYRAPTVRSLLCSALDGTDESALMKDLLRVSGKFALNDYYSNAATRGLSEAIQECGHLENGSLATAVVSPEPQQRVVFCATVDHSGGHVLPMSIAKTLHRDVGQFSLQGNDSAGRCAEAPQPSKINIPAGTQAYLVLWEPLRNDTLAHNLSSDGYADWATGYAYTFFDFKQLQSSSACGNGRQEAGELCDTGVFNGAVTSGCNLTCLPMAGFECSGAPLEPSVCRAVLCGDGRRDSGEECDDAGTRGGDGCSADCRLQPGYQCSQTYNQTSRCQSRPTPDPPHPSTPSPLHSSDPMPPITSLGTSPSASSSGAGAPCTPCRTITLTLAAASLLLSVLLVAAR